MLIVPTEAGSAALDALRRARSAAEDTFDTTLVSLKGLSESASNRWQTSKDEFELPEWMGKILRLNKEESRSGSSSENGGGDGKPPKESNIGATTLAGSAAANVGYDDEKSERPEGTDKDAGENQMMLLTRKMIEIRNLLQNVGQFETLTLPSIVVIGSQSSGKSSVLEAIVGHEFLPKGSNMVTRRPIELTLVNTPHSQEEYGEFPTLGLGKISDFSHIQRTLTDLNLSVPLRDCVSKESIQLHIYSPNVPDLTLIDLPGYIQVESRDQPPELKQRISELCDQYIRAPNLILAISAADVDLANSTALRASRRVDPRGERTIGVITKMDLVDPAKGASLLSDKNYPLRLGYIGVICNAPAHTSLFSRGSSNILADVVKHESSFFKNHPEHYGPSSQLSLGTSALRDRLMRTLQQSMTANLASTRDFVSQELEEATYEFKVQYNDRPLSADSYLAESLDNFKRSFKEFSERFGRPQVRELLKEELDQWLLNILAARYWNKPFDDLSVAPFEPNMLKDLPKADPESLYWHRQLDASTSALTKLGLGRLATTKVANAIQAHLEALVASSTFASHPHAQQVIIDSALSILNDRFFSTSDQVENCIKPYKFEIEVEDSEWLKGRENVSSTLKNELKACERALTEVQNNVGKKKLKDVMSFVKKVREGEIVLEGDGSGGAGGFSSSLLAKGRQGVFLSDRADLLKMRMLAIRSKQCNSQQNKYYCPEIFLDVVADKLTATAVLFLNVELLAEFYHHFPRELDARLGRHLSHEEVENFAREDSKIRRHLDIIQKKEQLELVLQKIEGLRQQDGAVRNQGPIQRLHSAKDRQRNWRIF